jgi:wobble nucleotide-excising tRNase
MIITRISLLRACGVFREFPWPNDLATFGRYNLIYGWNGSGKTTLSRLFRALETRTAPGSGQVTFSINGKDVSGDEFAQATIPVRVFNRDFMSDSVFPVEGRDVPPIFVVGKENIEKQKEIDQLKSDLNKAQGESQSARSAKQEAEKAFDKFCIDRAKVVRDTLRSAGSNPYNNYDKSNFKDRAQRMADAEDSKTYKLSETDRDRLLAQQQATPKPKVQTLTYRLPTLGPVAETVLSELLPTTVVSATLQALKDDPGLSAWARQGLGLHQERHEEHCLFCEQVLPSGRLAALEAHFNAEYERLMKRLDNEIAGINATATAVAELKLPNRAEFYDDLAAEYDSAEAALRQAIDLTKGFLDSMVQALEDKKMRPFECMVLDVAQPEFENGVVEQLTAIIQKHNQACDDFQIRVSTARNQLEEDSVAGNLDEFQERRDAVLASEASIEKADAEVERLNTEIARLERNIIEHRRPAEELTEDLRKYLGHSELCLETKDTGYAITRKGMPAQALSEGETTAIALLYFLKSLKDRRFDLAKGVVVLDDPVSSLDANALYLAFGFIRERTKDAAQLFILTHNFTFFREVRNWFRHLKGEDKKQTRFYMLDCASDGNQRCSTICPLDPLLKQYESEYHYLFARIYRSAAASPPSGLEDNYILPNMARRLLEAFLAFRQPHISGELWQKLNNVEFEEAKKLRIIRFLHTHSHGNAIGEPEHDPSLLGEAGTVLMDLLDFIKSQDTAHFEAMVKLVGSSVEEGGDG